MNASTAPGAPGVRSGVALSLIIVGAALFILGPVLGLLVASSVGFSAALGDLSAQARFTQSTRIEADDRTTYFLYTSRADLPEASSCDVTLDDGRVVEVSSAPRQQNTNAGLTRFESFARFELPPREAAAVHCDDDVGEAIVGPGFDDSAFLSGLLGWTVTGGGLVMALGFALAIVGIVKYPRRAAEATRA